MESFLKTPRGKFFSAAFNILFFAIIGGLASVICTVIITRSAEEILNSGLFGLVFGALIGLMNTLLPALATLKETIVQKITKGKNDETND